jgi:hypothetical protein
MLDELLEPYAGLMSVVGTGTVCMAAFDRVRAMMAAVLGDFDRAEPAFVAALERDIAIASPPLEARTRYWYARMLFARGRDDDDLKARAVLDGSAEIAGRLGMTGLSAAAAALAVSASR